MNNSSIFVESRGSSTNNYYTAETTTLNFIDVIVHINVTADGIFGIGEIGAITLINCFIEGLADSLNYGKAYAI